MSVCDHHVSETLAARSSRKGKKNAISWSRQGHIAYALDRDHDDEFIKSEGNLRVTYLECIDGKHWQLAPPTFFNIAAMLAESSKTATGSSDNTEGAANNLTNKNSDNHSTMAPTSNALANPGTHRIEVAPTNYVLFSNTGWDLFTADENGYVTILVTGIKRVVNHKPNSDLASAEDINHNIMQVQFSRTSFNTCEIFYSEYETQNSSNADTDPNRGTNLKRGNQILDVKWLNLDKSVISNIPALRIQQNNENQVLNGCASKMGAASDDSSGYYYRYNAQQHKSYGASHPLPTKQACIAIRRNGELCLYHQQEHGIDYGKVSTFLEDTKGDGDLIYKSSIAFQKDGKIIIAAYYAGSKILRIYEITIEWNYLQTASKLLAENPNYRVPKEERILPKIVVKKIHQKNMDSILEGFTFVDIDAISPNFEADSLLDILLKFENKRVSTLDPVKTVILRYQLENIPVSKSIHQSFKNIASKNGIDVTTFNEETYKLSYSQTLSINDSVISLESLHLDMYVAIVLSSGVVKVFQRKTFTEEVNKFTDSSVDGILESSLPSSISTLLDAGYEFPTMDKQVVYCAISPNMCSYVSLPINGNALEVACVSTRNVDANYFNGTKKGLLLAKAAAFALRHTTACYFGYFTDDLVATIRNDLMVLSRLANENYSYRLMISIVQEAHRAINLNIDIPPEQSDKMTQNQPLQRLLTLQLSLGTSENWKKTRSGKIALVLVNLRYVASSVMYTIHTIYSNMQRFARKGFPATDTLLNAKMREECILSVIGVIRWCLDYIVLLSQELLELHSAFKSQNAKQIEKLLKDSIVIPLILGKIPRAFLVFSIANIRRLFSFVQKFIEKTDPNLTAKITSDNPLGAFDAVEEMFLANESSMIQRKFGGAGRVGTGANSKFGRAVVTVPTVEAYYRLGLMIKRLPVSLVAFEKFLSEADGPLRNMKLDAPMSLAVEQQIVCQGYVSKNFIDAMRKLSEVFNRSVLSQSGTRISDLYFYDVSWLNLENLDEEEDELNDDMDIDGHGDVVEDGAPRPVEVKKEGDAGHGGHGDVQQRHSAVVFAKTDMRKSREVYRKLLSRNIRNGGLIDNLRKEWVSPEDIMKSAGETDGKNGSSTTTVITTSSKTGASLSDNTLLEKKPLLRKCIRCGAISLVHDEVMFVPNSMAFVTNPVFQHYQRICICGGSWANV